ncbi:MAG: metallophosphoesterase [Oligoflexus sp.]|jgi:tartrate-resistant acid phosphatase type 5
MRRYRLTLLLFGTMISALILTYQYWRSSAPDWQGQSLLVERHYDPNLKILIIGDTGSGNAQQHKVAAGMERYCLSNTIDAVLMLGDNFYPHGVNSVADQQWQTKFHEPYGLPCLSQIPFYSLLGNHDYQGQPEAQIAYQGGKPSWNMPHRFYTLRWGDRLDIVMIDSNRMDLCGDAHRCSLDFLRQALAEQASRQVLVLAHHPILSRSAKYQQENLQGRILHSLLCDQADAYIAGHSHHLEHRTVPGCKVELFVNGAGGAGLYEVLPADQETRFVQSTHGFMSLEVKPEALHITFFDTDLNALHEAELPKH